MWQKLKAKITEYKNTLKMRFKAWLYRVGEWASINPHKVVMIDLVFYSFTAGVIIVLIIMNNAKSALIAELVSKIGG